MTKSKKLLSIVLLMSAMLTGCGVGEEEKWEYSKIESESKRRVIQFVEAIEDYDIYDIESMLAPEFSLSIEDKATSLNITKDTDVLLSELKDDEIYQRSIRENGIYEMAIDLDYIGQYDVQSGRVKPAGNDGVKEVTVVKVTEGRGTVLVDCNFEVYEMATTITNGEFICTDRGSMSFELIYIGGDYMIRSMNIIFNGYRDGDIVYTPRFLRSYEVLRTSNFGFTRIRVS